MKVTVIGAGNVGATCANVLVLKEIASEVVILDVAEGIAEGKAMDIAQSMPSLGFDTVITGVTNDYSKTANSQVVVVTSGMPRKPGMSREDLVSINVSIVESVVSNALEHSPNAIFIIVTNPLDTMTLVALNVSGLPKNRVIGMGGVLDSARFKYFLSQKLGKPINEIHGMVIGGHGDTTMIPLKDLATYKGISINELLSEDELSEVVGETMVGGATLTKLLGTSAWYAPGAAAAEVVDSILGDKKKLLPSSVYLEGEYGATNLCIGVPCIIGRNGVEEIVSLKLTETELVKFNKSVEAIKEVNALLDKI
jgi:malate dehydrogenase